MVTVDTPGHSWDPASPPHLGSDDAASSVKVSRPGRSLWARDGPPPGARDAPGGEGAAELPPLDRWLCRGALLGAAAPSALATALSSDPACAPVASDQALAAEEAGLQAELAAASAEVRSLAATAAAAEAQERHAEAAAAAARAHADPGADPSTPDPDQNEAFRTPVKRAKHG
ncbi:hypothetical protein WJX81_006383 [Elliptochloris bilobata]|uniref:Uncharacterized protein n=1 Tax=Elliptochloris bilobata TaxID=381761 RepID=A0AAW1RUU3_9CHLO